MASFPLIRQDEPVRANPPLLALVLEEFHLLEAFFGFFLGLVRTAEVFSLLGQYFITTFYFFDHQKPPGHCHPLGAVSAPHG